MNYEEISKETITDLYKSYESLKQSPLNQSLRILLELRVSQLNGCNLCCSMHTQEAEKSKIESAKIQQLSQWQISELFSNAEKAALAWSESITRLDNKHESIKTKLLTYFSEREIVDITLCVTIMNALNRLAISLQNNKSECSI